jgi:hypothetical protein
LGERNEIIWFYLGKMNGGDFVMQTIKIFFSYIAIFLFFSFRFLFAGFLDDLKASYCKATKESRGSFNDSFIKKIDDFCCKQDLANCVQDWIKDVYYYKHIINLMNCRDSCRHNIFHILAYEDYVFFLIVLLQFVCVVDNVFLRNMLNEKNIRGMTPLDLARKSCRRNRCIPLLRQVLLYVEMKYGTSNNRRKKHVSFSDRMRKIKSMRVRRRECLYLEDKMVRSFA